MRRVVCARLRVRACLHVYVFADEVLRAEEDKEEEGRPQ